MRNVPLAVTSKRVLRTVYTAGLSPIVLTNRAGAGAKVGCCGGGGRVADVATVGAIGTTGGGATATLERAGLVSCR